VVTVSHKEFRDLASPERAHEVLAGLDVDPGTERVPLADATGRVLADRVDAGIDVPGFDRASMDGYAVRGRDTFGAGDADPVAMAVVGTVHAGEPPDVTVGDGEAVEISTGAVLPDGADAVVMVEDTETADGDVLVRSSVTPGEHVMPAGADVAAGERALGPGTRLTAREVGLLSALGVDEVPVRARPTVGVVSTGDELVRPGEALDHGRGEIHDVNSYAISAAVEEAGGEARLYPHVGDDFDAMERVLREAAAECDLVLTSGSTSAGAVDVVYRVIEDAGELLLHGVAVKPGKPVLVGTVEGAAYVGLPGYPVSALTIFRLFVAPVVRDAAGLPPARTATVEGTMAVRERYDRGRRRLVPVGLVESAPGTSEGATTTSPGDDGDGRPLVYPVDKGSGATTSLVEADGVVVMPADVSYIDAGEVVEVELFSPDVRVPRLLGVGEDDPAISRLLDSVDRPRYLARGTRGGLRALDDGIADVCVATGPLDDLPDAEELATWTREWGLVVPAGNPADVAGLGDLVDRDLRFVNRGDDSGLRRSLDQAVDSMADDRGGDRGAVVGSIDGFDLAVRAHESPARRVASGSADAGLGLRATAERLDLGFVPLGEEVVRVLANPDRTGKSGVEAFRSVLGVALGEVLSALSGYE
jgi:putative molybdopterin biosynthesis protein